MSFATKLGQFTEGVASGIGPGFSIGANINQGNRAQQTLNNQTNNLNSQQNNNLTDRIRTRYENDPGGAINEALQRGEEALARELQARGPAEQTKLASQVLRELILEFRISLGELEELRQDSQGSLRTRLVFRITLQLMRQPSERSNSRS